MKMLVVAVVLALQVCAGDAWRCDGCTCTNQYKGSWLYKEVKYHEAYCEGFSHMPTNLPGKIQELIMDKCSPHFTVLNANLFNGRNRNLIFLIMRNGYFTRIDVNAFQNPPSTLTEIRLYSNLLSDIPPGVFSPVPGLKRIELQRNYLRVVQTKLFSNLKYLNSIWLNHNEITLIEKDSFYNLPSLERLDLEHNKLKTLSLNIMPRWNTLKLVRLYGNPWDCNEKLCPLINLVKNRALWASDDVPSCATPGNLNGRYWNYIQHKDIPAYLSIKTKFITVSEGANFTLKCKYCFPADLRWSFNGTEVSPDYQKASRYPPVSKLTIPALNKKQEGEYKCYINRCHECRHAAVFVGVNSKRSKRSKLSKHQP